MAKVANFSHILSSNGKHVNNIGLKVANFLHVIHMAKKKWQTFLNGKSGKLLSYSLI
jgi:hypothetical protein